ncbi:MAG: hypothetical protein ABR998_07470 [Gemmatimonadales bacterium]
MTHLQPPPDNASAPRTRPFTLFTVLAGGFVIAGIVQLFVDVPAAIDTFAGAGLMLGIREILRRSVPPE